MIKFILGDRFETVSIAKILKIFNIRIYHLCGGDLSLGSIEMILEMR